MGLGVLVNMPIVASRCRHAGCCCRTTATTSLAVDPGTVLAVVALLGLLYGIIESRRARPAPRRRRLRRLRRGVELRLAAPMFDVPVRPSGGGRSLVIVAAVSCALQGSGFVLTQYLQLSKAARRW